MNIFIVYAHPEQKSFNAALHQAAIHTLNAQGHDVEVSNLYRMNFEPVASRKDFLKLEPNVRPRFREEQEKAYNAGLLAPDILREQAKLTWCDLLILQFPLWWFSMPAMLKGWIDRVLTPGFAYSRSMFYNHGSLRGRKAMILLTTGGSRQKFSQKGLNGPIEAILFPIHHGVLYYVGFDVLPPFIAWQPSRMTEEQRHNVIQDFTDYLKNINLLTPIRFPKVEDIDSNEQLIGDFDWNKILNLPSED